MPDPFRQLRHGEQLPGLPRQPWNKMLESLKAKPGERPRADRSASPVEVLVRNDSGSPLATRFGILKTIKPRTLYSVAAAQTFYDEDMLRGTTPAAGQPFVVVQEPLSAGGFAIARLLGLTRVKVNLTDVGHYAADCTTATDKLTSAASGPARILWVESDETVRATGDQWAVVELLGQSAAAAGGIGSPVSYTYNRVIGSGGSVGNGTNTPVTGAAVGTGPGLFQVTGQFEISAGGTPFQPGSTSWQIVQTISGGTVSPNARMEGWVSVGAMSSQATIDVSAAGVITIIQYVLLTAGVPATVTVTEFSWAVANGAIGGSVMVLKLRD